MGNSSGNREAVGESAVLRHVMDISDGSPAWPKEGQKNINSTNFQLPQPSEVAVIKYLEKSESRENVLMLMLL